MIKIVTLAVAATLALGAVANAQSTNAPGTSTVGGEANPNVKNSSSSGGSTGQTGSGMTNSTTGTGMSNSNMGSDMNKPTSANPSSQGNTGPGTTPAK